MFLRTPIGSVAHDANFEMDFIGTTSVGIIITYCDRFVNTAIQVIIVTSLEYARRETPFAGTRGGRVEDGKRSPAGAAHAAAAEVDARAVTDAAARRGQELEEGGEERGAARPECRCFGARHGPRF